LSTPACLPLTTDYFPPPEELDAIYQEYTYTVSLSEDNSYYKNTELVFYFFIFNSDSFSRFYILISLPFLAL